MVMRSGQRALLDRYAGHQKSGLPGLGWHILRGEYDSSLDRSAVTRVLTVEGHSPSDYLLYHGCVRAIGTRLGTVCSGIARIDKSLQADWLG